MIPNILTTVRMLLTPIFAYLVLEAKNLPWAAVILILSGLTDVADGFIARHYNMTSNFGKIYDPFADKLMQITTVLSLTIAQVIPLWVVAVVFVKEMTMILIGGMLYLKHIAVHSNWYGKAATVLFYTIIFVLIVWQGIPSLWMWTLLAILLFSMLFAAGGYLVSTIEKIKKERV
ncbi:MAG: CDP-alcohol phosphatidyltransferase family protein [Clostridia bacterium]|nr:CDP-alcohol phosphatidyltransferase family protein [Clostridia bacterium]